MDITTLHGLFVHILKRCYITVVLTVTCLVLTGIINNWKPRLLRAHWGLVGLSSAKKHQLRLAKILEGHRLIYNRSATFLSWSL